MRFRISLLALIGVAAGALAACAPSTHSRLEEVQAPAGSPRFQAQMLERDGKGVEAVAAYRRVARTGDGKAANRLGEIYGKGIPGVDLNYAESLKWCYTARALGEMPNCAAR